MSPHTISTDNEEGRPTPTATVAPHKKLSRRKLFALTGSGLLVLVTAGGVWRAADQGVFSTGEGSAYELWDDWRTASKGLPDWERALGKMLPPPSQAQQDSTFLSNTAEQAQTAAAFGLLTVRDVQDRAQQLRAGRLLERMYPRVAQQAKLRESGAHETGMNPASKRRWKNILMIE